LETSDLKREISNLQSRLKGETERAESIEAELRRVEKEKNELDMAITAYSAGVDSVNAQIQQVRIKISFLKYCKS
jgi:septal ring factor EnvC (AmiA/AmiB activator)